MPGAAWLGPVVAQIGCDHGTEMIYPAPNGLVRDQNPAHNQQVFQIAKAECKLKAKLDRLLNHLRREAVSGIADSLHRFGQSSRQTDRKFGKALTALSASGKTMSPSLS
jgi:hypothetical protein